MGGEVEEALGADALEGGAYGIEESVEEALVGAVCLAEDEFALVVVGGVVDEFALVE